MVMPALWTALTSRVGQALAALVGVLAVLFAVHRNGAQQAENRAKAEAAEAEQEARRKGDEAAAAADRDGAAQRLRDGGF
jgi:hypothetical protein